jgi:hypothetical protein
VLSGLTLLYIHFPFLSFYPQHTHSRENFAGEASDDLRKNPRVIILPRVSLLKNNKILFTIFKINKN